MKSKICTTAIVFGAIICFMALGSPPVVKAGPAPTTELSCQDPASTLSAADCAHFIEIIRHLDRVSASTLDNLAFLEEIQTELEASIAYQDYLNQELSEAQSLALQSALDRTSKSLEVLSNIMKKLSDTADQLIQNVK